MNLFQKISKEMWSRFFYCCVGLLGCLGTNLWYISTWTTLLFLPITQLDQNAQFIFTEIQEAFGATVFLALFISVQMSLPLFLYQTLSFINPAYFKHESVQNVRVALVFVTMHCLFYVYFLTSWMHSLLTFFLQFQFENVQYSLLTFQAKILTYFQFIFQCCFSFQFLLLGAFLSFLVFPKLLQNIWFQYKHLIVFVTALVLSFILPPDGLLQCVVTVQLLCVIDIFGFFLCLYTTYQEKLQAKVFS
jgi:Sec-independent protein secretion pathway component TatC